VTRMGTEPRPTILRWASEYVVTAEGAGNALLVVATVLLVIAFCLPWWSLKYAGILGVNRTVTSYGFSGWGWLSFTAGLVVLALMVRLIVARGTPPSTKVANRTLAWVTVAAGVAELVGNLLFIVTAPRTLIAIGEGQIATRGVGLTIAMQKTLIAIGEGQIATRGVGLTIAMVAGVVLIASGLLMLVSSYQRSPVGGE